MAEDRTDIFTVDASALTALDIVDVIADFSNGDVLDLSGLLDTLLEPADAVAPAAADVVEMSLPVGDAGASAAAMVELAGLAGVHNTISILYDDLHTIIVS